MTDYPFGYDVAAAFREHPQDITQDEIAAVDAEWTDGADEPQFVWLFRLKDGRWAVGDGGHDYTGWDCRSHFDLSIHATRDDAIRFGLTLNQREHLGLLLPGESIPAKEGA